MVSWPAPSSTTLAKNNTTPAKASGGTLARAAAWRSTARRFCDHFVVILRWGMHARSLVRISEIMVRRPLGRHSGSVWPAAAGGLLSGRAAARCPRPCGWARGQHVPGLCGSSSSPRPAPRPPPVRCGGTRDSTRTKYRLQPPPPSDPYTVIIILYTRQCI